MAIILQEQWTKQCQTGELKPIKQNSNKEHWFKENWMLINKEKYVGVRDPNKQETKKIAIKETIASVILGMEKSNKDTTETQDNSNNMITFQ